MDIVNRNAFGKEFSRLLFFLQSLVEVGVKTFPLPEKILQGRFLVLEDSSCHTSLLVCNLLMTCEMLEETQQSVPV